MRLMFAYHFFNFLVACWYLTAPHNLLPLIPQPLHHDVEVPESLVLPGLHYLAAQAAPTGDLMHSPHVSLDMGRPALARFDYVLTELTGPHLTAFLFPMVA